MNKVKVHLLSIIYVNECREDIPKHIKYVNNSKVNFVDKHSYFLHLGFLTCFKQRVKSNYYETMKNMLQ